MDSASYRRLVNRFEFLELAERVGGDDIEWAWQDIQVISQRARETVLISEDSLDYEYMVSSNMVRRRVRVAPDQEDDERTEAPESDEEEEQEEEEEEEDSEWVGLEDFIATPYATPGGLFWLCVEDFWGEMKWWRWITEEEAASGPCVHKRVR